MYRIQDFLGKWQLVPERSVYSAGGPPKQATYEISGDQQTLVFTIDWVDQSDKPFHVVYTSVADGARRQTDISPAVDEMQTVIIGNNLQTLSYKDGAVTAIADRKLAADGQELEVLQRYLRPDGSELSILQFYTRG
ncbi:MAG: hypothetical protein R3E79_55050 [Caldilineaceae bacterium]